MKCIYFSILLVISHFFSEAQRPLNLSVKNSTYAATDSLLPFWFTASQSGKIRNVGPMLNLSEVNIGQPYLENKSVVNLAWGVHAVAALAETNYFQLNHAYAGISWKGWEMKAGMFYEPIHFGGLSTTNGNLARSRNSRPYPKLSLSTQGYKPVTFIHNRLSYNVEYSEGLLNDERYVTNARLHHKSVYLQVHLPDNWNIQAGLEHFAMWGGTSPEAGIGKLPSGFKDYFRYITGSSGDEAFPESDQRNVAGNQLGTWQFKVQKSGAGMDVSFYLSHPFEELSGLKWRNWPDNLLGLHLNFANKDQLITDIVYEYTNTRQQSIQGTEDDPDPGNYFRHGIYRSSLTYYQQVMGSPLFFPVTLREGIARGVGSNRFYAHHLGILGSFTNHLMWKGMFTWIHHFGLYTDPYEQSEKQLSGLLELHFLNPKLPVDLGLSVATDRGIQHRTGLQFQIFRIF